MDRVLRAWTVYFEAETVDLLMARRGDIENEIKARSPSISSVHVDVEPGWGITIRMRFERGNESGSISMERPWEPGPNLLPEQVADIDSVLRAGLVITDAEG